MKTYNFLFVELFEKSGLNQLELAGKLSITKGFVNDIINDRKSISLKTAHKYADLLGFDIEEKFLIKIKK